MSERSNKELLTDIIECIDKIFRYTNGMELNDFMQDERTVDAVVRNFEIIFDASNRIEESLHNQFPEVEWRRIIGLRHRIAHDYFGIDFRIIWEIRETKLADFKRQMENMLNQIE